MAKNLKAKKQPNNGLGVIESLIIVLIFALGVPTLLFINESYKNRNLHQALMFSGWDLASAQRKYLEEGKFIGIGIWPVGTQTTGTYVGFVYQNTPAFQAGLKTRDIILKINDKEVFDPFDFRLKIKGLPIGSPVKLLIKRNGKKLEVSTYTEVLKEQELP